MGSLWRGFIVFVSLVGAVLVTAGGAAAAPSAPIQVSASTSPFDTAACDALAALQTPFGSLNYLNSEVEPQVAVDPTNPNHLVGAWQQDRWIDGGANGLVAAYSTDGGATWTRSVQPFTACASGLDFERSSDPWVSIGPGTPTSSSGSTVYSVGLPFDQTPYKSDLLARHNGVNAAVSYDGGATWTNNQLLIDDPCISQPMKSPGYFCNNNKAFVLDDKESVTADPAHAGVAYAVWDRLLAPPASFPGFIFERGYFGQVFMSKTTDYGVHWTAPQLLLTGPSQDQTLGNVVVVDPRNGALYDFFDLIINESNAHGLRGTSVAFIKSADGGATWTTPHVVGALDAVGVSDSANVDPSQDTPPATLRAADDIPEVAINPATGQLYAVWQDSRFNGFANDETVISTSNDGGANWSPPSLVNPHTGLAAFLPTVAVNGAGVVGVTYYQWPSAPTAGNEPANLYIRHSTNPGSSTTAPTFGAPTKLDGPFNMLAAPWAGGYFLGDYQGLTATAAGFLPFYVKPNCADGGSSTQPSCAALTSVLSPPDLTPTDDNSTDVYAITGA
jgi:BNR/Asp-box repeat